MFNNGSYKLDKLEERLTDKLQALLQRIEWLESELEDVKYRYQVRDDLDEES